MGVSTNVYTIYGVETEWNDELMDALEDTYEYHKGYAVDCIIDGMSGEYMIFGILLYDSGDFRWGEMNGKSETKLSDLPKLEEEYRNKFKDKFPEFYHLIDKEWNIIGLVHYS